MREILGRRWRRWLEPGVLGLVWAGTAQTHKVAKPEKVVRAVGVYEWTGDQAKPKASRLVPVTVFIDGELRDGGVYLPQPIPFALAPGNEYEVERAGVPQGLVTLDYARHLSPTSAAGGGALDEDGWYGYGTYQAAVAKQAPALRASRSPGVITSSGGEHPTLGSKTGVTADPDRPTMKRRDADGGSNPSASGTPETPGTGADSPAADPDRPTLKRRTADSGKKVKAKRDDDVATVTAAGVLGTDPDRPTLHRGRPAGTEPENFAPPKLTGTPGDVHQVAAVSDAATRPEHDFARPWADEAERTTVLGQMRALAARQLAQYAALPGNAPATGAAATSGSGAKQTSVGRVAGQGATPRATGARARTRAGAAARAKAAAPAAPALLDEQLKGYLLSYGGAATYVYTAHTAGTGGDLRYVTVVAQAEVTGDLKPAISSVTDAAQLDRTPWMRFVDVIDAEASNRASLLFELRAQNSRQFALYRVLGDRADQLMATGTTP